MREISMTQIKDALALDTFDVMAAQLQMLPLGRPVARPTASKGKPRVGAVLLLLYCHRSELHLVLTKRKANLKAHGGQISFPGGRQDANETLERTALRETEEEVGVDATEIETVGTLTQVYIPPSDFEVQPFVGWVRSGKRPFFHPSPAEVAAIIDVPLTDLFDPTAKQTEPREFRGHTYQVPFFALQGHQVWGATAVILNEFVERVRVILKEK